MISEKFFWSPFDTQKVCSAASARVRGGGLQAGDSAIKLWPTPSFERSYRANTLSKHGPCGHLLGKPAKLCSTVCIQHLFFYTFTSLVARACKPSRSDICDSLALQTFEWGATMFIPLLFVIATALSEQRCGGFLQCKYLTEQFTSWWAPWSFMVFFRTEVRSLSCLVSKVSVSVLKDRKKWYNDSFML